MAVLALIKHAQNTILGGLVGRFASTKQRRKAGHPIFATVFVMLQWSQITAHLGGGPVKGIGN